MSVPFSEFLNGWNDVMPIQIRDNEVKNPTEPIFRRHLILLLKQFLVNTACYENMDNETSSRLKTSRVRLVATVNHFYKIAFPAAKQDFVFMDLVQPTYKKVFNVLNYLLNYAVFVRHTYANTILDTKRKLDERKELLAEKNQLRKEIEERKIKEENNIKMIKSLDAKIPLQKAHVAKLEAKEKALKNEMSGLEEESEKIEMKLAEYRNDVENEKCMEVSEQEVEKILSAKADVEKQLLEQDQITAAGRMKFIENNNAVDSASTITAKMEDFFNNINIIADDLRELMSEAENIKTERANAEQEMKKISSELQTCSQVKESKQKVLADLSDQKKAGDVSETRTVGNRKKKLKEKQNILRKLVDEEAELSATNQRLQDEQQLLYNIASNVIKHMSANFEEESH